MTDPAYTMNQSNFAQMYERVLVTALFRPWVDDLLGRVHLTPATRVLDVACGTGIVARLTRTRVGPDSRVVGLDRSTQMLDVARECEPTIEWTQGDAQALPFEPASFDAVLCQQGLQFFPDPTGAVREMRRVLAPAGRVAVAVWCALEEMPFLLALHRVAEQHLGPMGDPRYGFGGARRLETLLQSAGFADVGVQTVERTIHFPDGAAFARMNAMALVGMNPSCAGLDDAQRFARVAAIVDASAPVLAAHADGPGAVAAPLAIHLGTGRA